MYRTIRNIILLPFKLIYFYFNIVCYAVCCILFFVKYSSVEDYKTSIHIAYLYIFKNCKLTDMEGSYSDKILYGFNNSIDDIIMFSAFIITFSFVGAIVLVFSMVFV